MTTKSGGPGRVTGWPTTRMVTRMDTVQKSLNTGTTSVLSAQRRTWDTAGRFCTATTTTLAKALTTAATSMKNCPYQKMGSAPAHQASITLDLKNTVSEQPTYLVDT